MGPGTILKRWKDGDASAPACEGYNCECNRAAVVEIQGETDSFGYETFCLCAECYQLMLDGEKSSKDKFLEENRCLAPEGQVWLGTGDANDGFDWWYAYSQDKAKVLWDKNQTDSRWGSHGGLYRPYIRLVSIEEAKTVAERHAHRWEEDDYVDEDEQ